MFKKALSALALAYLLLGLQGCASLMHYEEGPYRHTIDMARDSIYKAKVDYTEKSTVLAEVRKRSSTPDEAVFVGLQQDVAVMGAKNDELQKQDAEYGVSLKELARISHGHDIPASDPDFQKLDTAVRARMERTNKLFQEYSAASNGFASKANGANINKVKAKQVQNNLKQGLKQLEDAAKGAHGKIAEARQVVKNRQVATLGLMQGKANKEALNNMESILGQIEAMLGPLNATAKEFLAMNPDEVIYRGPGIPRVKAMENLDAAATKMQELIKKFNDEGNKLK